MNRILRPMYDWAMRLSSHRHAMRWLFVVSFIESSIFPIPPDTMILPMALANRDKAWKIAGVATLASVLGGIAGYAIGYFFYTAIGEPLLEFYGKMEAFHKFTNAYKEWGLWIVAGAGFTPFPYKVITIASGVVAMNIPIFIVASILSRAARFFLLAALLWKFGPAIRTFIEAYLPQLTLLFFFVLLAGFLAIKYIF